MQGRAFKNDNDPSSLTHTHTHRVVEGEYTDANELCTALALKQLNCGPVPVSGPSQLFFTTAPPTKKKKKEFP